LIGDEIRFQGLLPTAQLEAIAKVQYVHTLGQAQNNHRGTHHSNHYHSGASKFSFGHQAYHKGEQEEEKHKSPDFKAGELRPEASTAATSTSTSAEVSTPQVPSSTAVSYNSSSSPWQLVNTTQVMDAANVSIGLPSSDSQIAVTEQDLLMTSSSPTASSSTQEAVQVSEKYSSESLGEQVVQYYLLYSLF
jgi:hypothetical protein